MNEWSGRIVQRKPELDALSQSKLWLSSNPLGLYDAHTGLITKEGVDQTAQTGSIDLVLLSPRLSLFRLSFFDSSERWTRPDCRSSFRLELEAQIKMQGFYPTLVVIVA